MRIITSSSTKGRVTAITIEAGKEENLEEFETMLGSHKWIRQNEHGELESAPAHLDPPILFDKDIDPIWDGKPATIRQLRKGEKEKYFQDRAFYVQSICGYDGRVWEKAPKLILAGFVPLRSKRSRKDGKCWEIWYLCGAWAAEGVLGGKTEKQILDWLWAEIRPGTIELGGQAGGLAIE